MASIRIKKFNPTNIKQHRIIFLIGKRHTGKSSLMIDILSKMPCPDFVMGFSPTDDTLDTFKQFIPGSCIFSQFSQDKLERLLSLQREIIRRGKTRSVLLILDDCMYQKGILKSTAMRDLFFNGRHLNVGLICAVQYLMDISPELRTNIDYLCSMRENTISNRQKLHKFFFGQYAKFEEFDRVMSACTQNYSALIMDATVASTKPEDCIYWYRASLEVPSFKLARPEIWQLANKYMKSEEEVRRQQKLKFQMETAGSGSDGKVVVQTADENGQVVN
ncbi:MAG: hypothetical protein CBC12_07335 [Candidatus Puniceispirillum sp. TMED52]|nr:MAG: hypothetical protein CBC12_07335 [Candidatus Puniceispirillum sp. TMED52]RPF82015.1 MAG: hypothetical protein CBC65_001385 [Rhodothermaceae bacterium TMED105]